MSKPKSSSEPEFITLAAISRQIGISPATIARSPADFFHIVRLGGRRYALRGEFGAWLAARKATAARASAGAAVGA